VASWVLLQGRQQALKRLRPPEGALCRLQLMDIYEFCGLKLSTLQQLLQDLKSCQVAERVVECAALGMVLAAAQQTRVVKVSAGCQC
jgi:hypothetical protein